MKRYGALIVVRDSGQTSNRIKIWECLCDCGETYLVRQDSLKSGATTCCKKCRYKKTTKHGQSGRTNDDKTSIGNITYRSWVYMKSRCYNPNHKDYPHYGEKGIIVCESWKNSFENFFDYMGERPSKEYSLDRIDVNGNYEPGNCKWSNRQDQGQNRTTTKLTKEKVKEIKILISEGNTNKSIAETYGVSMQCICDIKKGRRWTNVVTTNN
jgi:hypothetical protein